MGVSNVRIEKPRPSRRAFRFQTPILASCDLFGLFTWSAPGMLLASGGHLAVVLHAVTF